MPDITKRNSNVHFNLGNTGQCDVAGCPGCILCTSQTKDTPGVSKFHTKQLPKRLTRKMLRQPPTDSNSHIRREILEIFGQKEFVWMVEVFKSLGNFAALHQRPQSCTNTLSDLETHTEDLQHK